MILVIGGIFQGQLDFALNLTGMNKANVVDCETCALEALNDAKIILDYHKIIKRLLKNSQDVYEFTESLIRTNPNAVVLVDEVGCGVVPASPFDREYRESVGRVSCELAKASSKVYRVFCGIGTEIKGNNNEG